MDIPRYRIGNDLTVFWAIHNRDGSPYNFDGKEVHLFVTNDRGRQEVGFEFSKLPDGSTNNVLRWDFRGDVQRVLGLYKLSIEIHTGEDYRDITKDYSDAFVLVSCSEMECEEGEANIQDGGDLILSTRLDVYRIGIPKINIGTNGNWYIDDVDTGKSAMGGGQGLVNVIYGEDDLGGEFDSASVIDTFNAYAINEIYKRLKDLTLPDVTDVFINSPLRNDILYFNGNAWENIAFKKFVSWFNLSGGTGEGLNEEMLKSYLDANKYITEETLEEKVVEKIGEMFYWADEEHTIIGTDKHFFSKGEISANGLNLDGNNPGSGEDSGDDEGGSDIVTVSIYTLEGVNITSPAKGDVLMFNGNEWVNSPIQISPDEVPDIDLSEYAKVSYVQETYLSLEIFEAFKQNNSSLITALINRVARLEEAKNFFTLTEDGQSIYTEYNLFSTKEISANGLSLGIGETYLGEDKLGTIIEDGDTVTFSANAINSIYHRLAELEENGGGGGNVDVDLSDYYTKDEVNDLFTKDNIKSKLGIADWALKSSLAASDVPNLPWSKITSGKPTTLAGYGITDAMAKNNFFEINGGHAYIGDGACNIYVRGELQSWPSAWSITKAGAASFKSLAVNGSSVLTASDLDDYGFLTSITKSMVTSALGYTPFNSASFTKSNIKSTLQISDWALASSKPSYSYSEINGAPDNLSDLTDDILNGYYLKLTGGTITGNLTVNKNMVIGSATLAWKSTALEVNKPFYSTGEISANGLYLGSDIRFKNQLGDISLDLDTIANAPMFRFTWNNSEDESIHIGSSAQYWEEHARELVSIDDKDFHRLDYSTLGVLMGISLAKRIKELEMKIGG